MGKEGTEGGMSTAGTSLLYPVPMGDLLVLNGLAEAVCALPLREQQCPHVPSAWATSVPLAEPGSRNAGQVELSALCWVPAGAAALCTGPSLPGALQLRF